MVSVRENVPSMHEALGFIPQYWGERRMRTRLGQVIYMQVAQELFLEALI